MQPSPVHLSSWGSNDIFSSHSHSHMPNSFNFRDISMQKPAKPDYFSLNTIRGSSPTASLAADLSQNFHIDMRSVTVFCEAKDIF